MPDGEKMERTEEERREKRLIGPCLCCACKTLALIFALFLSVVLYVVVVLTVMFCVLFILWKIT
jgi:hypothetical protein